MMKHHLWCIPLLLLLLNLTINSGCFTSARAIPEDMLEVEARHLTGVWHITQMRDWRPIPDFAKVFLSFKPSGKFDRGPIELGPKNEADPSANLLGMPPCGTYSVANGEITFVSDQINEGKPWKTSFTLTGETLTLARDPFLRWGKDGEECRSVYTYRAAK